MEVIPIGDLAVAEIVDKLVQVEEIEAPGDRPCMSVRGTCVRQSPTLDGRVRRDQLTTKRVFELIGCNATSHCNASSAALVAEFPVYFINLKRRSDRRGYLDRHMNRTGVPYQIWEATDGQDLALSSGGAHGGEIIAGVPPAAAGAASEYRVMANWSIAADDPKMRLTPGTQTKLPEPHWYPVEYWSRPMTTGEIATAISHGRLWRYMAEKNKQRADERGVIIFEDDVAIDPAGWCQFSDAFAKLNKADVEWDIMYMHIIVIYKWHVRSSNLKTTGIF